MLRVQLLFLLLIPPLLWAGNFVFSRYLAVQEGNNFTPIALAFYRWSVALAALLLLFGKATWSFRSQLRKHFLLCFSLALMGPAFFNTFIYIAIQNTTALNASLINSTIPVITLTLNFLCFKITPSFKQVLAILLSCLAVVFLLTAGAPAKLLTLSFNPADFLVLLACLSWAAYSVLLVKVPKELPQTVLLTFMVLLAWLVLLIFFLWDPFHFGHIKTFTALTVSFILYTGLFASVFSYLIWTVAVMKVGANLTSLFINFMPLLAALLSIILLGETFQSFHFWALCFIVTALYLAWKKPLKNKRA